MTSFNLTRDAWIPVRRRDGIEAAWSLTEAFRGAAHADAVSDTLPTSRLAVVRLMAAVLARSGAIPDAARWEEIRSKGEFPAEVGAYLEKHASLFDLFGDRPFMQSSAIRDADHGSIEKLRYVGETTPGIFSQSDSWANPKAVAPGAAARLVLQNQLFDRPGLHSCLPGEEKACKLATLTDILSVIVRGETLFETVLLNSPPLDFIGEFLGLDTSDEPWWERGAVRPGLSKPTGYLDLLTRPTRRIHLAQEENGTVKRVALMKGLEMGEHAGLETMAPWKRVKEFNLFIKWRPDTLAWQNSTALFASFSDDRADYHPSPTVEWLKRAKAVPGRRPHRLETVGTWTGGNAGKVDLIRSEELRFRPGYLIDPLVTALIREAVGRASLVRELVSWAVRRAAAQVFDYGIRARAGVRASKAALAALGAAQSFAASLEVPFQKFLDDLHEDSTLAKAAWAKTVSENAMSSLGDGFSTIGADVSGQMIRATARGLLRGAMNNKAKEVVGV